MMYVCVPHAAVSNVLEGDLKKTGDELEELKNSNTPFDHNTLGEVCTKCDTD